MSSCKNRSHQSYISGGGPTGVEFAAELHDLLHSDIRRHYPSLAKIAKINLYDVAPSILGTFDKSLASWVVLEWSGSVSWVNFWQICGTEFPKRWDKYQDEPSCREGGEGGFGYLLPWQQHWPSAAFRERCLSKNREKVNLGQLYLTRALTGRFLQSILAFWYGAQDWLPIR